MSGKPVFIVLEGADGCGKTTVGDMLASKLGAKLMETPPAEICEARKNLDALYGNAKCGLAAQLFYASAVAYASESAKGILARGQSVVVVRYWASTVAYNGIVRKSEMDDSAWLDHIAIPHFTCLLEVSQEERRRRMSERDQLNETDKSSLDQNARLEQRYCRVLSEHKERAGRILRVPNDGTREECVERILKEMANAAD